MQIAPLHFERLFLRLQNELFAYWEVILLLIRQYHFHNSYSEKVSTNISKGTEKKKIQTVGVYEKKII